METICIRCNISFESDSPDMDLCPNCEIELKKLDDTEEWSVDFEDADDW